MTTPPIRATLYAITDLGRTRDHNEDTFLVADLGTGDALRASRRETHAIGDRGMIFLVADGMGGAAAGELASEMAAVEIHRHMVDGWAAAPMGTEETFATNLRRAVEAANVELHQYATTHPEVRGMGTTATVVGVWRDRIYLAQIGDSRAYLIRGSDARQLTRDQSLTQRLVEVGELTEEEAEASERRNIILQALGPDPRVKVDLSWQMLQRDDLLILCSDGLSGVVRRDDIAAVAREAGDVQEVCERLVAMANDHGGPDNITVVAVRFDGEGLPAATVDEPGYHEYPQADERPGLQPTAAFPAATAPPPVVPPTERRGSPTTLALIGLGLLLVLVAVALLL
jgi:protein phosphatase